MNGNAKSAFFEIISHWLQEREFVFVASYYGAGGQDYCFARSISELLTFHNVTAFGRALVTRASIQRRRR